jgi:hypothetical protein
MARQSDFDPAVPDPADHRHDQQQRERRCLSCGGQFASTGPGNRICRKCKDRDTWKSGVRDFDAIAASCRRIHHDV